MNINIDDLKKEMREIQERMKERGKQAFKEGVQELFNSNPNLKSFSWTQYTPYFNDGDECVFGVNADWNMDVDFNDGHKLESYGSFEKENAKGEDAVKRCDAADAAIKLVTAIPEDLMKQVFGDHVKVTVFNDKVEVENYEHD